LRLYDWKPINNYGRGKFALEFEVTEFDEDEIRYMVNKAVAKIQKDINPLSWYVKKKEDGDFAMSFPWKATNSHVCSDCKTKKEAQKICDINNEAEKAD